MDAKIRNKVAAALWRSCGCSGRWLTSMTLMCGHRCLMNVNNHNRHHNYIINIKIQFHLHHRHHNYIIFIIITTVTSSIIIVVIIIVVIIIIVIKGSDFLETLIERSSWLIAAIDDDSDRWVTREKPSGERWWLVGDELLSPWVTREKKRRERNQLLKSGTGRSVTSDCNRRSTARWLMPMSADRFYVRETRWVGCLLKDFGLPFFSIHTFQWKEGYFRNIKKNNGICSRVGMGLWFPTPVTEIRNSVITPYFVWEWNPCKLFPFLILI